MESAFEASASGKVILLGEHAVVYGVPALAAGLSRGARARATPAERDSIAFNGEELPSSHELLTALRETRTSLGVQPVRLELTLEVPAGAGLGGSASLGVATTRALAASKSELPSERDILRIVDQWERLFHGNASGVDARASFFGGVIRFVRGEEPAQIPLARPLTLVVSMAAPPASTKTMVESVARLRATRPEKFEGTLASIGALVESAVGCLRVGDVRGLGKLMDLNHMLLGSWLLSTQELEDACRVAREAGALGAKMTGSGGGGAIIALVGESPDPVLMALESAGYPSFVSTIGSFSFSENR